MSATAGKRAPRRMAKSAARRRHNWWSLAAHGGTGTAHAAAALGARVALIERDCSAAIVSTSAVCRRRPAAHTRLAPRCGAEHYGAQLPADIRVDCRRMRACASAPALRADFSAPARSRRGVSPARRASPTRTLRWTTRRCDSKGTDATGARPTRSIPGLARPAS